MNVKINGAMQEIPSCSLTELLQANNWQPAKVVVELNLKIIPPEQFSATTLQEGDTLEILQFVGGG